MARGRKRQFKRYFDVEQEEATIEYLECDDDVQRNVIYETHLREPLFKMVESIINRYQLYSKEMSFDELLDYTLGFLHMQIHKFQPSKGKAYSYFGTIIKRNLIGMRMKEEVLMLRNSSFESQADEIIEDERHSYQMDEEVSAMKTFFYEYISIIEKILEINNPEDPKPILKDGEEKIGYAIIHLMRNWEDVFEEGAGHKYNKNQVLECLKNMTGLGTKDIRDNLKVFKKLYFEHKQIMLNKEDNE